MLNIMSFNPNSAIRKTVEAIAVATVIDRIEAILGSAYVLDTNAIKSSIEEVKATRKVSMTFMLLGLHGDAEEEAVAKAVKLKTKLMQHMMPKSILSMKEAQELLDKSITQACYVFCSIYSTIERTKEDPVTVAKLHAVNI